MTLSRRDLLAGMAMQGWITRHNEARITPEAVANSSVEYANALIEALDKTSPQS